MNHRERVLKALSHQEPDRVPIDLSGHRSSGISAIAYAKLRKHLGLEPRTIRVYDPIQQLAIVDPDVLDLFDVDTIELGRAFAQEEAAWADWTLPDGTPCKMPAAALPERAKNEWVFKSPSGRVIGRMPDGVLYFEQAHWPFFEKADINDIPGAFQECMWTAIRAASRPTQESPDGRDLFAEGAKKLRESTDRAIIGLFGGNLLEIGQFLYRNDNFLMKLAAEPKEVHAFLDKLVEIHLGNLEGFLGSVGKYIDVIMFGDDLGMQRGPQISPKMYQEFFKPRHGAMWRRAKELADVKVQLHCCGDVYKLMPDLIEAGLDAINPVQTSCPGMDPARLKKEFGREMVFWGGGCDTQEILNRATPDVVSRHVKERIEILKPGGGFVFQQVHNIMADVPPANIEAMYKAITG